ncbi:aminotransferase [Thalassiosira pseudonana CCMP1335]
MTSSKEQSSPPPPPIRYDLYRGHPNNSLLPTLEIQSILSSCAKDKDSLTRALKYGTNEGDDALLSALRSFIEKRTVHDDGSSDTTSSGFFITSGVSHGLELLCATCTNGGEVWVERPTYFLAPKIFQSHGLVVKPLPMLSDRLDLNKSDGCVPPPKMMYIIPSYHNPTGRSMTVAEREKLASFAIRNGILLVADEVYHLLDWERELNVDGTDDTSNQTTSPTLKGCCISVSSFTKIFAPGIRLGWIQAPPFIIQRLISHGYIISQGGVAPFTGRLMTNAIESGLLDSYLNKLKMEYAQRCDLVCDLLKVEPRIVVLTHNSPIKRGGGYFLWVQFPFGVDSDALLAFCMNDYGVKFMPGSRCDPFAGEDDDNGSSGALIKCCARLCFADLDRDELVDATKAVIQAFRSFVDR